MAKVVILLLMVGMNWRTAWRLRRKNDKLGVGAPTGIDNIKTDNAMSSIPGSRKSAILARLDMIGAMLAAQRMTPIPSLPHFLVCSLALVSVLPLAAEQRFRILFGGADSSVVDWSGSLSATSGTASIVTSNHFGPGETFDESEWKCGNQWDGKLQMEPADQAAFSPTRWKGVVVDVDGGDATRISVETAQGNAEFRAGQVRYQETLKLLEGRIRVERVPRSLRMSESLADDDYPAIAIGPDGRVWVAWIAFEDGADTIQIRSSADGETWDDAVTLAPTGEYYQVALVSTRPGAVTAVASAIRDGLVHLYKAEYSAGGEPAGSVLTGGPGPDTFPRMVAASNGDVYLVYQSGAKGNTDISLMVRRGNTWSSPIKVTEHPANDWEPSIALNSRGEAAIAWDSYRHGNYDIFLRRFTNGGLRSLQRITSSEDFQAHVSLVYDHRDRLWMAWDNGGPNWGKDHYGINGIHRGESGLYFHRQAQVRVLDRGRIVKPVPPIDHRFPPSPITGSWMALGLDSARQTYTEYPMLQVDGKGRVWVILRARTLGRANPPSVAARSIFPYWDYKATMFDGYGWTPPVWLPFSDGRNEQRPAATVDAPGNLWVVTQTDGKSYPPGADRFWQYDVYAGKLDLTKTAGGPVKDEFFVGTDDLSAPEMAEDAVPELTTPLWKAYQMEVGGEQYHVTWGDLHRHTDLSFDGYSDGSLYDCYRYAIDAAQLDFLGPSEHVLPEKVDTSYLWRMVDKAVDVYKIPGFFYPLLNYERTVAYPDGHRNIVWRGRGYDPIRIKPGNRENGVAEDDMLMLWKELLAGGRAKAISIPHTSATQMGTDWRYNNEQAERLVEMFQGNRDSYEYLGAPRSATAERIVVGGYITSGEIRPKGFIWNALEKGYKMGFIASSDHRSTHMSYAAVYTPDRTYADIWDSLHARRTYASTDNIIVDFQSGGHAMGEEFSATEPPRFDVRIIGTGKIEQIDVIKDNTFAYTAHPDVSEVTFTYTDSAIERGTHYFYVRVIQEDSNMAWGSPIWIEYKGD